MDGTCGDLTVCRPEWAGLATRKAVLSRNGAPSVELPEIASSLESTETNLTLKHIFETYRSIFYTKQ